MPNIPITVTGIPKLDQWIQDLRRLLTSEGLVEYLQAWVADDKTTALLGKLPANSYILGAHLHVTEAFDSTGTDLIECGWDSDNDAIFTATDVSTTGVKSPTLGANNGFNSSEQTVNAYYTAGGTAATLGKALVTVLFARSASQIV